MPGVHGPLTVPYTSDVRLAMARHLSVVAPPDSPAGRLHRAYNAPNLLDAIAAVEALRADLVAHQLALVARARKAPITWEAIGAALGTSRQGAFNRYGALVQRDERVGLPDADYVVERGIAHTGDASDQTDRGTSRR